MKSSYKILENTWCSCPEIKENYEQRVTLPLNEWREYVISGKNTLLGSGGIIPSGNIRIPFGGNSSVLKGKVRQGIGYN